MKIYDTLALIATLSASSIGNAVQIGFYPFESPASSLGLFDYDTNVDIYLMSGGRGPSFGPFSLLPDRIHLGTYQFNDSLIVSPFEFNLAALLPLLSNGVDEYLSLVLLGDSTVMGISRLESEWFGTPTDLIGIDIPNPTFEINELRSDLYGDVAVQTRRIDYLDLGVTIVPEPPSFEILDFSVNEGLLWESSVGVVYAVESTTNLKDPESWGEEPGSEVIGNGSQLSWVDPLSERPAEKFYRIIVK